MVQGLGIRVRGLLTAPTLLKQHDLRLEAMQVPHEVVGYKSLTWLDFSFNRITSLPPALDALTRLLPNPTPDPRPDSNPTTSTQIRPHILHLTPHALNPEPLIVSSPSRLHSTPSHVRLQPQPYARKPEPLITDTLHSDP